jgi:hypothetical protein
MAPGELAPMNMYAESGLTALAEDVRSSLVALDELERLGATLPLPEFRGTEWYAALSRKLAPQLGRTPTLILAVVGGTNIGKSVVFNHLAGERISASSPLASGTKHPTCVCSPTLANVDELAPLFEEFRLVAATDPDAPLGEDADDLMFFRASDAVPENLLLLDTPDIDSDAPVNWRRADAVRHAADVLVAVLTMQKYNDAAVKRFFRAAAEEDKPVVIVFNQVLLPEDDEVWPKWCATFTRETGISPLAVYVAPHDRRAAEGLVLPFHGRAWPPGSDRLEVHRTESGASDVPLKEVFARLRFGEIKLRTLAGAVSRVVRSDDGLPRFLESVRDASARHAEAVRRMGTESLLVDSRWPMPPSPLFVAEVRQWWSTRREGVSKWIHDGYGWLGTTLWQPVKWVTGSGSGEDNPWDEYRERERAHVTEVVERILEQLSRLASLGNDVLRPRLEAILAGDSRRLLLEGLETALRDNDPERDLTILTAEQLALWQAEQPALYGILRQVDRAAAFARPALTVSLAVAGAGPVGGAMLGVLPDLLAQSLVVHVAGETIATAGTVAAGESTLTVAARGLRELELWFGRLQGAFLERRSTLLAKQLEERLLGNLLEDLRRNATLVQSAPFEELSRRAERMAHVVAPA